MASPSTSTKPDPRDHPIIATAEDAITTKHAAIEAGYYKDPFVEPFYYRSQHYCQPNRPVQVIIKRGTFARVACVSKAISSFLSLVPRNAGTTAQVVVLGAGKDTSYFRLIHNEDVSDVPVAGGDNDPVIRWAEVDHPSVIQEKAQIIQTAGEERFGVSVTGKGEEKSGEESLGETFLLKPVDSATTNQKFSSCHLISYDLRDDPNGLCETLIRTAGFQAQVPTLFVSECVFMYLPKAATEKLVDCISETFSQSCLCLYEPVLGNDAFGRMMQDNLTRAGVAKLDSCLVQTRSIDEYAGMLLPSFSRAVGCDMYAAYETVLSAEQRQRANQCEFLDELEEFMLIMRHYCLLVACTDGSVLGKEFCQTRDGSRMGFVDARSRVFTPVPQADCD